MDRADFPNPTTRAAIRLAEALNKAGLDDMRESLKWLDRERKNMTHCWCVRDTYSHIAKLLRRDIRRG